MAKEVKGKDAVMTVDGRPIICDPVYDNNIVAVNDQCVLSVSLKQAIELIKQGVSIEVEKLSKEDKRILYRALQTQDGIERAVERISSSDQEKEGT